MRASELMHSKFLAVSVEDRVGAVLGKLESGKHTSAVVLDSRDRYVGLFNKEACLRSRGDPSETKVRSVLRKTSKLEESTDVLRIAKLLQTGDVHILPVLDKYKRVIGIVGSRDVLKALLNKVRGLRVQEVASKFPLVLSESESVSRAVEIVKRKKVSRIPVIDKDRKLVGVVTMFDLLKSLVSHPVEKRRGMRGKKTVHDERPKAGDLAVSNIMQRRVQTAAPASVLQAAVRKMITNNISDLIVVEDGLPVGVLTSKDILKRLT